MALAATYRTVMRGPLMRRLLAVLVLVLLGPLLASEALSSPAQAAEAVTLPDLHIFVPTDKISIGIDPNTGDRELRFTHITADIGSGPFEIDPHFNAATGTSTFTQAIYRSNGSGGWTFDHSVPLAAAGVWNPPSDYAFPLTHFVLQTYSNAQAGKTVATSPKIDYCITGDTELSGVPNTPGQTFIPVSDCTDPTKPLGWSVGWGDEYDQTDSGQPIDLTGVPNGTYLLKATVDPYHVLAESNTANDVTDTELQISGDNVTVVKQWVPRLSLSSSRVTSPTTGESVSGRFLLHAVATPVSGTTIVSAQFVLDGEPLGPMMRKAPFSYLWDTAAVAKSRHYVSLRVTDSAGDIASARPVAVTVLRASSLVVRQGSWQNGYLTLKISGAPKNAKLLARVTTTHQTRSAELTDGTLRLRTPRPTLISIAISTSGKPYLTALSFTLSDRPSVAVSSPAPHMTLSGIVPISAVADDVVGVLSVHFAVDGHNIGEVAKSPYAIRLDTRHLKGGTHFLTVTAYNGLGRSTKVTRQIEVQNPAPTMTCYVMQATRGAFGQSTVSTGSFHTVVPDETVLAFVSSDGPASGTETASVSGGGLSWHRAARADSSAGDSEIWSAMAYKAGSIGPITATLARSGYNLNLTVVAMEGADGPGATAAGSGKTGAPKVTLKTLSATSLVFAVGNDWDQAVARKLPVGWQMLSQHLDTATGDTFWVQYTNQPTGKAGSQVVVQDLAPTTDRWNLAAAEVINSGT
jgi:hypothetical protein